MEIDIISNFWLQILTSSKQDHRSGIKNVILTRKQLFIFTYIIDEKPTKTVYLYKTMGMRNYYHTFPKNIDVWNTFQRSEKFIMSSHL